MKTNNYIIVASDHKETLSEILKVLNTIDGYNIITISSITLLNQLLSTISPKLLILSFENNSIELNYILKSQVKLNLPVLCLTNQYENVQSFSQKMPIIIVSLKESLSHNYLLNNIKSILLIHREQLTTNNERSFDYDKKKNNSITENKNLARYVLELDQKKVLLKKIKERIKELSTNVDWETRKRLNTIISTIKLDSGTSHWDDFKIYFENINPGFIDQLMNSYPCLTTKDIKYCCYLKMNMSNEDIRYLLGINKESVRTHKYRLKKKMILEREQDLNKFITSF